MFERITVRQLGGFEKDFDAGLLAEVILYYGEVHLILDYRLLRDMCRSIGVSTVIRLLRDKYIKITYMRDNPVIMTHSTGYGTLHSSNLMRVGDRKVSAEDEIANELSKLGHERKEARKFARELKSLIAMSKLNDGMLRGNSFIDDFQTEIRKKPDFLSQARIVLGNKLPTFDPAVISRFRLEERVAGQFYVDTDVDWNYVDATNRRLNDNTTFNAASVLYTIQDAFIDLGMAGRYGAELLTNNIQDQLVTHQVWQMTRLRNRSEEEIAGFNQKVLGDSYAIREAINSKLRSFDDFLAVMDNAQRFREMLRKINPDDGFLGTYLKEVAKGTFLDRLGPKSIRMGVSFVSGTVLDAYVSGGLPVFSTAITAFDGFFLDNLVKGWRPNKFIENSLVPFVTDQT